MRHFVFVSLGVDRLEGFHFLGRFNFLLPSQFSALSMGVPLLLRSLRELGKDLFPAVRELGLLVLREGERGLGGTGGCLSGVGVLLCGR